MHVELNVNFRDPLRKLRCMHGDARTVISGQHKYKETWSFTGTKKLQCNEAPFKYSASLHYFFSLHFTTLHFHGEILAVPRIKPELSRWKQDILTNRLPRHWQN